MSSKVIFKTHQQDQLSLLPPSYDDLLPKNHPVRIVNIVDHIDISALEKSYKGGGILSYHPRMLIKVVIYSYLRNIYSSIKIEQGLQENVHFMWLSDFEEKVITAFVKYNYFHKEQREKKHKENPFHPDNLFYNPETDTCPMGQAMKKTHT